MHLFFLSRGGKWHRDKFVNDLSGLYVPRTIKDTTGKMEVVRASQVLLQPIEFWSLVFPEENLDKMLRTLQISDELGVNSDKCPSPTRKFSLNMLRKFLKLKKIPKWEPEGPKFPLYKDHLKLTGIGIKEDYKDEYGNECL